MLRTSGTRSWDLRSSSTSPFVVTRAFEPKILDTFTIIGPCVTTSDEIDDPHDLKMELQLNGETCHQENIGGMIYSCADIIEYASIGTTIEEPVC